jgi:metal-responsive CopG/Arc/MetJ family transcriptional regulator
MYYMAAKRSAKKAKPARQSKVFTVSFPKEMARQVSGTAKSEHRSVSELLREAMREYWKQQALQALDGAAAYATTLNQPYRSMDEIQAFIDEIRAERAAVKPRRKAS